MTLNPRAMARALGGRVSGRNVVALGPGHSRADRSLSIKIEPTAPDGFIVHPFAGDSPIECLDYVRARLGLGERDRRRRHSPPLASPAVAADDDATHRSALALRLWSEARDPRNTVVARYLAARGLSLPDDVVGDVIRFHPALKFNGASAGGMVALFRDIRTKAPCGIHRTFFDGPGRKLDRKMLGRVRDAAIKLDPDECVTSGVHIGEGLELCLARMAGRLPPSVGSRFGERNCVVPSAVRSRGSHSPWRQPTF